MILPAPGIALELQPEQALRRMNVFAEARGEPALCKVGVDFIARTRAHERSLSIRQEIFERGEFSWVSDEHARKLVLRAHQVEPLSWGAIDALLELVDTPTGVLDPTHGANHYYNPDVVHPPWGEGHPDWVTHVKLGRLLFGRCP